MLGLLSMTRSVVEGLSHSGEPALRDRVVRPDGAVVSGYSPSATTVADATPSDVIGNM
jgi:hypothetical protein